MCFPQITTLHIMSVTAPEILALTQHCKRLRYVEFSFITGTISSVEVNSMCDNWHNIECLHLPRVAEGLVIMLVMKCTTLNTLICGNHCPDEHISDVVYPINYPGSRLHTVSMECNHAATLHTFTTHCPYLHTLYMYTSYRGGGHSTVPYSAPPAPAEQALHYIMNTNIKHLSLSAYKNMTDTDIMQLQHSKLKSLSVADCKITNGGVLTLLPTLLHLHTLKLIICNMLDPSIILQIPPLCSTLHSLQYVSGERNDFSAIEAQMKELYPHVTKQIYL